MGGLGNACLYSTKILWCLGISVFLFSCTVSNNFYVNNPVPFGKGTARGYVGLASGIQPKVDSVSVIDGRVYYTEKISVAPILALGAQIGVSKQADVRVALHFPKILGGIGLRGGFQYSFFPAESKVNMALGTDLGFVVSKDSIRLFGWDWTASALDKTSNSALNGDVFLPVSFKLGDEANMVITPRYSFYKMYMREFEHRDYGIPHNFRSQTITIGLQIKKIYLETSIMHSNNIFYTHVGIAKIISIHPDDE
ncbi:MAG: hypothetical protein OEW75_03480 [Cyclobacteriaceae bacterium]|nr:hypothetical protein [Cyclobacteriaceae bacterium]